MSERNDADCPPLIGDGIASIWVVWSAEYDYSDAPRFLAAYDGPRAEELAKALVDLIKRAGCNRNVQASVMPLWPLLQSGPGGARL